MERLTLPEELQLAAVDHLRRIQLVVQSMTLQMPAEERLEWLDELDRASDALCATVAWLLEDSEDGEPIPASLQNDRLVPCQWEFPSQAG